MFAHTLGISNAEVLYEMCIPLAYVYDRYYLTHSMESNRPSTPGRYTVLFLSFFRREFCTSLSRFHSSRSSYSLFIHIFCRYYRNFGLEEFLRNESNDFHTEKIMLLWKLKVFKEYTYLAKNRSLVIYYKYTQ